MIVPNIDWYLHFTWVDKVCRTDCLPMTICQLGELNATTWFSSTRFLAGPILLMMVKRTRTDRIEASRFVPHLHRIQLHMDHIELWLGRILITQFRLKLHRCNPFMSSVLRTFPCIPNEYALLFEYPCHTHWVHRIVQARQKTNFELIVFDGIHPQPLISWQYVYVP